jgi:hypothetical protein
VGDSTDGKTEVSVLVRKENKAVNRGVNRGWFSRPLNGQILEKLGGVRSHMRTGLRLKTGNSLKNSTNNRLLAG